jgi:ABC-2 type transport system ATP-binding protein
MGPAIETHRLRKRFGAKQAVADLSLSVGRGEVFGFLGPNGAGKTTSLKMLLGLIAPSGGTGSVLGAPIGDRHARAKVGFLPEHFRFQDWLTGRELMRLHGRLTGLAGATLTRRCDALLERVALTDAADRALRGYSKGMLQRVGIAAALVNEPQLVFLDEPTSGLDPLGRLLVRDLIRELRAHGVTVFLNSHLLGEVEATCDRVVFLKAGRIVAERRLADDAEAGVHVELRAEALGDDAWAELTALGRDVRRDGAFVRLTVADDDVLPEIAARLVARGARLHHLVAARPSLEAQFLAVMGDDGRPG